MKKSIIILLLLVALFSMDISFAAADGHDALEHDLTLENNQIELFFVGGCPIYSTHHMIANGNGYLVNKSTGNPIWDGQQYVCACDEVLVIKGSHWPGGLIGDYAMFNTSVHNYSQFYRVSTSVLGFTPYNYLDGVSFY